MDLWIGGLMNDGWIRTARLMLSAGQQSERTSAVSRSSKSPLIHQSSLQDFGGWTVFNRGSP